MKLISLMIAFLILLFVPVAVIAQSADGSSEIGTGILGIVIAVASTLIMALGIGGSSLRNALRRIQADHVDFAKIDRAVEIMLQKVGIPATFADYIGDIIAQLATRADNILDRPWYETLKEIIIDEISRRSALQIGDLTEDAIAPAVVPNRAARIHLANKLVSSPQADKLVKDVVAKISP
jgi:hypothetical protein